MGFEFSETLRGTYIIDGQSRPMSFSVKLNGSAGDVLSTGRIALEGEMQAQGFAENAEISGDLIVSFRRTSFLRYEFDFVADDGAPYRFFGEKTRQFAHPVRSMTELAGSFVAEDGTVKATCALTFDVASDLGSFLRSFRIL